MAYTKLDPPWAKGIPGAGESVNAPIGGWLSADRLIHMENGIIGIDTELTNFLQNYTPSLSKTGIAKIISYPFTGDFSTDGSVVEFSNMTLDVSTPSGSFKLDIPAGSLPFQHGMNICVDSSSRATELLFIQADWPTITDTTIWAIGAMQQNGIILNGTATQRKVLSFYSGLSLVRDFT